MESDSFEDKVKDWLAKGAKVSRKAMETVGDKVQDFTDKSVIKMERRQLLNKLESKYTELGKEIFRVITETGSIDEKKEENDCENNNAICINFKSEEDYEKVKQIDSEIKNIIVQIAEKEKEMK